MKRILLTVMLAASLMVPLFGQGATGYNIQSKPNAYWWTGSTRDIGWNWAKAIDNLVAAGSTKIGTGSIFYVDSGVTNAGDGSSWSNAVATLDEAVNLCTDNAGDVIYVAEGHNEALGTGADVVDIDVIGVTVIGCGRGNLRPRFDFDDYDTGSFAIGANNITIIGLNFLPSVTDVNEAIEVEATGDYCTIYDCWLMDGEASATDEFLIGISVASGANYVTVANCRFDSFVAGATSAIGTTAGVNTGTRLLANVFEGDWSEACIDDDDTDTFILVAGNVCKNANSGNLGIEFSGAATGICAGNLIFTDAVATALDPGSMGCFDNWCINTTDLSANRVPALPAIGTVTAGSAEDILKKLYYGSDGTGAYPATVANDSALAMVLSKSNPAAASSYDNTTDSLEAIRDAITALGISGVGTYADEVVTHMDANSILADLAGISEIGDKVVADMDANSILADLAGISEIGDKVVADMDANSILADLAGISEIGDKVQADMDANSTQLAAIVADTAAMDTAAELSVLADPNKVTYDAPRILSDTTSAMTAGNGYGAADDPTIFAVTGDIVARVFAIVDTSCTSTSSDTLELGVTGDTACLLVQDVVDGVAFQQNDCWTLTQAPDTPSAEWDGEWVIIPNGLDIILTINDHDMTAGVITFYLQWIPLSADAAVTGSAP